MRWADVVTPPPLRVLRQFAALCLLVFGGLAAWQVLDGRAGGFTALLAGAAGIGILGLVRPAAVRPLFVAWLIVAFPIGWTVSRLMLALVFFGLFTPLALFFRLMGRDELRLRRPTDQSLWRPKAPPAGPDDYLRQF